MILIISPGGAAIGVAHHLRKEARKHVVLFAPSYQQEQLAGIPNIAGGKSTAKAFAELYQLLERTRPEYIVIDMIEEWKPIQIGNLKITCTGDLAEDLHKRGFRGIGIFPFAKAAEQIEFHRQDGATVAAAAGINVPQTRNFDSISEGIRFLQSAEARDRVWVFKPNDNKFATYVPDTTEELIFHMTTLLKENGDKLSFILQEKIHGIEVDIEGWFVDGEYIQGSTNITLESKTHMTGNLGLPVGCATTVQKAISEESYLFQQGLAKYFPLLRRWQYTGTFSLTAIVDDNKQIWYLENCVRMGWDAFYALLELYEGNAHEFFLSVLSGSPIHLKPGWGVGIRVTVPPYPLEGKSPEEKQLLNMLTKRYLKNLYLYGVRKASRFARVWLSDVVETDYKIGDEPVYQVVGTEPCVVTAYHPTSPFKAEQQIIKALDALVLPNMQARIGDAAHGAYQRFQSLIDRKIIITEERRIRQPTIGEVIGSEETASD